MNIYNNYITKTTKYTNSTSKIIIINKINIKLNKLNYTQNIDCSSNDII